LIKAIPILFFIKIINLQHTDLYNKNSTKCRGLKVVIVIRGARAVRLLESVVGKHFYMGWTQGIARWKRHLYHLLRFSLGVVFLSSGGLKLCDPTSFSIVIDAFGILPDVLVWPSALLIAGAEVLAGIGLILEVRGSLALMAGLLSLFMIVLGYGIWIGLDIDCGCFGAQDPEGEAFRGLRGAFYRDIGMMMGVLWMYFLRFRYRYDPMGERKILDFLIRRRPCGL
jgi:hypothetical protein